MKTLKKACQPRKSIFDPSKRDTVLSLNNLIKGHIKPEEFFEENYLTQGMRLLLETGFKRLEGKSDQGVFRLTQAMGGGKTHNLIAFGLLAKFPEFRKKVMESFYSPGAIGAVRVVSFTGRESDATYGVWGSIAEQLGKREFFKDYYSPLKAPGQSAWTNLLKGEPVVIMLDELPPYFENAKSHQIGNADLSVVTGTALANLFVAVMEDLPNVCVIITDLTASYTEGSQQIVQALNNLHQEANRVAMDLEPVRMNTDEFYHILRKRIFQNLPPENIVEEVAQGYSKALRDAKMMDITSASPEAFAGQILESYPFHPSIRDLYARFKENQGFQQTRELIRFMRVIVAHLWERTDADAYLIAPHTIDLNHRDTLSEIRHINPTLENAIANDIASEGKSVSERLDANLGGQDTQDVSKLLLMASLANVPGATRGLAIPEIIAYLCEPGRDISRLKTEVLGNFTTAAWYLHTMSDGKLYFKNVQNLIAKLNATAKGYGPEQSLKELKEYLVRLFTPETKWCYQDVLPLPGVDDIKLNQEKVTLVISQPHQEGLHPDLKKFFEQTPLQNRICFLTGQRNFDSLLETAKRHKAIQLIVSEMVKERVPANDPQMIQALDIKDKIQGQFLMSVKETFNTLQFPNKNGLSSAEFLMKFTGNEYKGENQIMETLKEGGKYTDDVSSDTFLKKVEARIFTQKRMPWSDIMRRTATTISWQWHRPDALDTLKSDCVHKGTWREDGGGYVEKGPFPLPNTDVKISFITRDDNTGAAKLKLVPINADTIFAEVGAQATPASKKLEDRTYETPEMEVSFLAVDSTGQHKTGDSVSWKNTITIKSRAYRSGKDMMVELRAAPPEAPIRYTTDGSNPKTGGGSYEGPFPVQKKTKFVQAVSEFKGVASDVHTLSISWEVKPFEIDPTKAVIWRKTQEINNTTGVYEFISRLRKYGAIVCGITVSVNQDSKKWIEANVGDGVEMSPDVLEGFINKIRELLDSGEVSLRADRMNFAAGQGLIDYASDMKCDIAPNDVVQGELV